MGEPIDLLCTGCGLPLSGPCAPGCRFAPEPVAAPKRSLSEQQWLIAAAAAFGVLRDWWLLWLFFSALYGWWPW